MSTKGEPTPGEWFADDLGYVRESRHENAIGAAFDDMGEGIPIVGMLANARLFAASKRLLENLEFAYAYLKKEPGGAEWNAGLGRMRAAIAQAKGDQ